MARLLNHKLAGYVVREISQQHQKQEASTRNHLAEPQCPPMCPSMFFCVEAAHEHRNIRTLPALCLEATRFCPAILKRRTNHTSDKNPPTRQPRRVPVESC